MNKQWDDKFGLIDVPENNQNVIRIKGIGKDAEIITNEKGGKQSKAPMALHLIDPEFLYDYFESNEYSITIDFISQFMITDNKKLLIDAIKNLASIKDKDALIEIAKVLQYGAKKYEANNWRLIPQEEHINHALIHYYAYLQEDTQDDHLEHCMCRLMMAYATEKSERFSYNKYVSKEEVQQEKFFNSYC